MKKLKRIFVLENITIILRIIIIIIISLEIFIKRIKKSGNKKKRMKK
jgi:hypothetical protein